MNLRCECEWSVYDAPGPGHPCEVDGEEPHHGEDPLPVRVQKSFTWSIQHQPVNLKGMST